jgi:hypothetical protein
MIGIQEPIQLTTAPPDIQDQTGVQGLDHAAQVWQ